MKKFDQINVIPFIDIMLVLLAIVLTTASFIAQGRIKVNVPEAATTESQNPNERVYHITVTADGQYYLDDQKTTLATLGEQMATWSKTQIVSLKIDAAAAFNTFIQISDLLRSNNLKNVQVVTAPKNT